MQRAQNAHQDRGDVVFLFVDTWENGTERKNAQAFIDKNKYTFNVLMDNDNEVVGKYKVEGIPTKFIIGRDGHIRFKSVGYSGNEDALVDEMSFMIELAGEGAVDGGRMEGGR
ncbi:MAG: TlpA family protein disulfide reductase [Haliscomenobacter sp.]|nr:TlpA family protein disulfide reductase [Haliscomenobacter sp.]